MRSARRNPTAFAASAAGYSLAVASVVFTVRVMRTMGRTHGKAGPGFGGVAETTLTKADRWLARPAIGGTAAATFTAFAYKQSEKIARDTNRHRRKKR